MSAPVDEPAEVHVDLGAHSFAVMGDEGSVSLAIKAALVANGARPVEDTPDLLIVIMPLVPANDPADLPFRTIAEHGRAMAGRGDGRIVIILSALAGLPMRAHLDYSVAMAAATAAMRGLAMQLAPKILVNALGAGVIEDDTGSLLSGDRGMLSHASLGRPGKIADLTNAVLFLCDPLNSYTTGQLLTVDGGWNVGYGRNF